MLKFVKGGNIAVQSFLFCTLLTRFQGKEVAAILDDESDWNDLDEEAKEEEKREASEGFNADEK